MATDGQFRVGVTRDIRGADGSPILDLTLLEDGQWEFLPESDEITVEVDRIGRLANPVVAGW